MSLIEGSRPTEAEPATVEVTLGPGVWSQFQEIELRSKKGDTSPVEQMIDRHTLNTISLGAYFTVDKGGLHVKRGYTSYRSEELDTAKDSTEPRGKITLIKAPNEPSAPTSIKAAVRPDLRSFRR